jgi:hypothetical protein
MIVQGLTFRFDHGAPMGIDAVEVISVAEQKEEPGRHQCEACGATFSTKEELDQHVKDEHEK